MRVRCICRRPSPFRYAYNKPRCISGTMRSLSSNRERAAAFAPYAVGAALPPNTRPPTGVSHQYRIRWEVTTVTDDSTYVRSLALGIVSGMRSMLAPALVARKAVEDPEGMPDILTRPQTRAALGLMAVGELVVDKLPFTPSRTVLPSVLFRALSGALVGAAFASSRRASPAAGAAAGALGAVAATYAAYHVRQIVDREFNLADPLVAVAEDALATGIGMRALNGG